MMLQQLLQSQILISIIIGFIIGFTVFYYFNRLMMMKTDHGPNSKDIVNAVFQFRDKYYQFVPEICFCPLINK